MGAVGWRLGYGRLFDMLKTLGLLKTGKGESLTDAGRYVKAILIPVNGVRKHS